MSAPSPLARAWSLSVYYTLFVILFGAVVRISGSGAGCGQHWPSCHGEIAHLPQSVETLIEMTHRLTSGLDLLLVFGLTVWTYRTMPQGHGARTSALWASILMITEALVGAGLVLLALVGRNDSISRALVMALHLINTSALLLAMVGAAYLTRFPQRRQLVLFSPTVQSSSFSQPSPPAQSSFWGLHVYWLGALLIVLVSAAGAVTALGDTVYPVGARSSLEVARQLSRTGGHFLEHLRGVHPLFAGLAATFWVFVGARLESVWGRRIVLVCLLQVGAGLVNIYLSAPGWMQVIHLALANVLWLVWILAWLQRPASIVHASLPSDPSF